MKRELLVEEGEVKLGQQRKGWGAAGSRSHEERR